MSIKTLGNGLFRTDTISDENFTAYLTNFLLLAIRLNYTPKDKSYYLHNGKVAWRVDKNLCPLCRYIFQRSSCKISKYQNLYRGVANRGQYVYI